MKLDNDHFECCSECFNSLEPSKNDTTRPPTHAIANGFAIGQLPFELKIEGEDTPRQSNLRNRDISDIMHAAVDHQRLYGFTFAFMGGAPHSVKGQAKPLQNITI